MLSIFCYHCTTYNTTPLELFLLYRSMYTWYVQTRNCFMKNIDHCLFLSVSINGINGNYLLTFRKTRKYPGDSRRDITYDVHKFHMTDTVDHMKVILSFPPVPIQMGYNTREPNIFMHGRLNGFSFAIQQFFVSHDIICQVFNHFTIMILVTRSRSNLAMHTSNNRLWLRTPMCYGLPC